MFELDSSDLNYCLITWHLLDIDHLPSKTHYKFMKKKYAKSLPEYDEIEFDEEAVLNSRKIRRKMPTSISLSPEALS